MTKELYVIAITDLSQSFVDQNGSFYCGSTPEHKQNAAMITKTAVECVREYAGKDSIIVFNTDLHPYTSLEFNINRGLYLPHNMPKRFWGQAYKEHKELEGKSLSPELTGVVRELVKDLKTGIFVPRHVYFQEKDRMQLSYLPEDVEETFGQRIITRDEFLEGDYKYIIAPKKHFDATRISTNKARGRGVQHTGVPSEDENIFSLILEKYYPEEQYELILINPSVVEGICTLMTATGERQEFPRSKIWTPSDGVTPLVGFQFETAQESREACKKVAGDMGIEYKTTDEIVKGIGG